jgi:hypothetical protein
MAMALACTLDPAILHSMDHVFGRLSRKWSGHVIPLDIHDGAGPPAEPVFAAQPAAGGLAAYQGPQPPPTLDEPAKVQAAYEWFLAEKARLDEYTNHQFAAVRKHQEADLARHRRNEEALILRSQELNREMQFLASQSQALQSRARELADWESSLHAQMFKLTRAHEELLNIQKTSENIQRDTEAQQASLEQLRSEMAQLQAAEAAARTTFASFDSALTERQQAWEKKQADLAARQLQMEQRYQALEQAEEAASRRLAELEDLEDRLREDFESQQQQLVRERQDLEALYKELRGPYQPPAKAGRSYAPTIRSIEA